jgi:general secretion pathway protein D
MAPTLAAIHRPARISLAIVSALAAFLSPAQANSDPDTPLMVSSRSTVSEAERLAGEALKLIAENKLEDASIFINQALQLKIDKSYFHLVNGLVYHLMTRQGKQANYDLAAQGYAMAIRFDPGNWMARYFLGRLRIDEGKYDSAVPEFAEALMIQPEDPQVLNSLMYAAYRNGSPDIAAGAMSALESKGKLEGELLQRNAAIISAALGQDERADVLLEQLRKGGMDPRALAHVERRIADWKRIHRQKQAAKPAELIKTQFGGADPGAAAGGAPPAGGGLGGAPAAGGGFGAEAGAGGVLGAGAAVEPISPNAKMVVVDVVLISTEETISAQRGVNLLNGLQLQFGSSTTPGYQRVRGRTGETATAAGFYTDTVTRTITIPAISYSLNIFNAANQRNEVLARPSLVALTGRQSEFFSGVELNAVSRGGTGTNASSPISIQKEIGVQLSVTPNMLPDGRLQMTVTAQRTFIKTPNPDATFEQKLETTKNKVSANVVMRYGETLILGGLSEKESGNTRDGVPGLQDIPLVQYLFSRRTSSDFQKSVLILITPRPAEYVYQPEKARQEHEKTMSEDERPIASLRARYSDWFKPYPNWASVFHQLQENSLYREFRTGDVDLESWSDMRSVNDRLRIIKDFIYY